MGRRGSATEGSAQGAEETIEDRVDETSGEEESEDNEEKREEFVRKIGTSTTELALDPVLAPREADDLVVELEGDDADADHDDSVDEVSQGKHDCIIAVWLPAYAR